MLHLDLPVLPIVPVTLSDRDLLVKRVYDATARAVWAAWTDPERLARWWGPVDSVNTVLGCDPRPGGDWCIHMAQSNGAVYPLLGTCVEAVRDRRLVLILDVSGYPPSWHRRLDGFRAGPATDLEKTIRTTVDLHEEDQATRLTIRQRFCTISERDAYVHMGLRNGWGQSLDKLEELLVHPSHP